MASSEGAHKCARFGRHLKRTCPPTARSRGRAFEGRWYTDAGRTDDIRILDIDGDRHYFYTTYLPWTPAESRAELEQIVESLRIAPVGGRGVCSRPSPGVA
jgi:hypothetical protein